jgi:hypothetical protein
VEILDPFRRIIIDDEVRHAFLQQHAAEAAVAVGWPSATGDKA